MQRLHLAHDDTAWLPLGVRAAGSLYSLMAFLGITMIVAAVFVALWSIGVVWYGSLTLLAIPAAYRMRDGVARSAMRGRMRRLDRSAIALAAAGERDGQLVRVRGRIRAQRRIPALLSKHEVVFRRMVFRIHGLEGVEESASDFLLDDDTGQPILILVEGARFVADDLPPKDWSPLAAPVVETLATLNPPPALADAISDWRIDAKLPDGLTNAAGSEQVLRDGDTVEVVGYRARTVDPTMAARLPRETPIRAALQGATTCPLLVSRANARP
jgi:hypothetical protein